jgi:hypothetical protein
LILFRLFSVPLGLAAIAMGGLLAVAGMSSAAPLQSCAGDLEDAQGVAVPDARSIQLDDGRTVRIAGIESFALLSSGAEMAESALQNRLTEHVTGKRLQIRLLSSDADRYGRLPALIALDSGTTVQETLLQEGVAIVFATDASILPCFAEMLAAEDTARREALGFWTSPALPYATTEALAPLVGRFAIFEGVVLSVGNRTNTTYLNFGYRWSEDATVEISADDRGPFGGEEALATLAEKRVRVRGFLEEKAGPMIRVRSPMQIEVLGEPGFWDTEVP